MTMQKVRLLGRLSVAALLLLIAVVAGIQFERVIVRNWQLGHTLAATRADLESLREKERRQLRKIERLHDPHGAIPEIHDRLHLVAPREELIYLKGAPTPAPSAYPPNRP